MIAFASFVHGLAPVATTVAIAIVVLGLLILFHELGHFLVAKWCRVGVLKFSIGFGPALISKKIGQTEYAISAIPLGGFVKMVGEDPDEEVAETDRSIAFQSQPLWKRFAIVFAGPFANLLFAFVAFALVFSVYGARIPTNAPKVGGVMADMPAALAGLQAGDVVKAVDGKPIETWEELSRTIRQSGPKTLTLLVEREGRLLEIAVTPKEREEKNIFGEVTGKAYLIGIEPGFDVIPVGPLGAIRMGAEQTAWWVGTIFLSLAKMVQGKIPASEIGGPILIAQTAGQQARHGLENLIHFMAVISVNLGVLNLLPVPVLDGGHLFFFLIEAVRRRPLDTRYREVAQQVGLLLLLALMAFAFYNDIARVLR
ncbi:MAG: zinc metalloprotease [Candidatus Binatia bacterium]|nr:MAG: zinc metalloprotease [Candidatus Binatia bacterium]